ncbi:Sensor kinase CckA [Roseibaca ekhonensis]|uniref:histidine kinase n=1 Tax=Roseinatronobacter ekhonensis TaxID=254356 RepID=A0A3B0M406_9RHOB|nr:PAS domain-containing protein [Roseibaca ekhonensis]SUZ30533.1 Sensor kinase CckA [Roseibaca ekhonensis]
MTSTELPYGTHAAPVRTDKGTAALTRVFAQAARDLQRCAPLESDSTLDAVLGAVGSAMGTCRAYVFEIVDTVFIRNTHEWCAPGIVAMKPELQHVPYHIGAVFWDRFREYGSIQINDVTTILPNSELRQILDEQDISALMAAPFWRNGEMIGFVGLDYTSGPQSFLPEEDNLIRALAAQVGMLRALKLSSRDALRVETELDRARARLSATVAALPELLVETNHDGVIIGFHQSSPLTFAARPQEVIGQPPETVLPAHLAAICRKAMREVDLLGWSQAHSYAVKTPVGQKWYTLYATSRSLTGAADAAKGYLFVVRDVTHAQRQDRRVRQLVRVAELSNNLIMLTDEERRIRWMNPAAIARTGYTFQQAEGLRPSEILNLSQSAPDIVEELCRTLNEGHAIHRELPAKSQDGSDYWLDLNVQPLHDSTGAIEGYMVLGMDTTSHKMAEARLLNDRSRAMSASHEGIAIIRPNGRLSYANPALRQILDLPKGVRLDALMWTDITPADLTERMTGILPVLMSEGVWHGEFTRKSDDGALRHFSISLSVEADTSTLAQIRDITRRKQAEQDRAHLREQLQKAQARELGAQLAAGLAHDFANVLATISGSVDVLSTQLGPEATQTIDRIRTATGEARELARGLTRLDTARPKATTLALAPVLQQAADLLTPGLEAPIRLELDLPDDSLHVHGDRMELMQLVLNLALNARDACRESLDQDPDGPNVLHLRARPCPPDMLPDSFELGLRLPDMDYALIELCDSGDGIPQALGGSIFAPYVTSKGDAGAGLGLAVVANIVTTRGAALRLLPNTPKGTRVQVFWPCRPLGGLDMATTSTPLADTNILLVDNDDLVLQQLADTLVRAGAEVASCIDPADALEAITQAPHDWDLVLTDFDMGTLTGSELAKAMHAQREDLPIILMTGNSELHFATKSVHTDFAATLRKPICSTVLISVLLAAKLRSQRHI